MRVSGARGTKSSVAPPLDDDKTCDVGVFRPPCRMRCLGITNGHGTRLRAFSCLSRENTLIRFGNCNVMPEFDGLVPLA